MNEQRKDDILFCKDHGKLYRWKEDNHIVCCFPGCKYKELDRRNEDSIPTKKDINETWRGNA